MCKHARNKNECTYNCSIASESSKHVSNHLAKGGGWNRHAFSGGSHTGHPASQFILVRIKTMTADFELKVQLSVTATEL